MNTARSKWLTVAMSVAGLMTMLGTAYATATPAQTCQSGKNHTVGKYAGCRQQAEAKFALSLDGAKRTADLAKCEAKYQGTWPALEAKAVAKGGVCPSVGDQTAIQSLVDQQAGNIATALGAGGMQNCPADLGTCNTSLASTQASLSTCQAALAACQAGGLGGQLLKTGQTLCYNGTGNVIACAGTGQDGQFQKGLARSYTDNGNGTITDNRTGLMWEKLSDDGSILLSRRRVPERARSPGQFGARAIARQSHAELTSSRTKWRRITLQARSPCTDGAPLLGRTSARAARQPAKASRSLRMGILIASIITSLWREQTTAKLRSLGPPPPKGGRQDRGGLSCDASGGAFFDGSEAGPLMVGGGNASANLSPFIGVPLRASYDEELLTGRR